MMLFGVARPSTRTRMKIGLKTRLGSGPYSVGVAKALSQLRSLRKITFFWTHSSADDFCNIVAKNLVSEGLEHLGIDKARFDTDILCGLIARHKDTLLEISCRDVTLFNGKCGKWAKVIRVMQMAKKLRLVFIDGSTREDDGDKCVQVLLKGPNENFHDDIEEWLSDPEEATKSLLGSMLRNYRRENRVFISHW